jgi:DNA (cytosine-5)-methyltransferase 1
MHWPDVERHADVRLVGSKNLARVDVVCLGFPCQDISIAGLGRGLAGARSGLWFESFRVVGEICPRVVLVENVAALAARGLDVVAEDLRSLGYCVHARIVAAADIGAPHLRERLYIVAHADGERVRIERQRMPRRRPRSVRARGQAESVDDGSTGGRRAQPEMGRGAHGLPDRVDRWPSRPGDAAALWEPARSVTKYSPTRAARLEMLGNAQVPQVIAEEIAPFVAECLR